MSRFLPAVIAALAVGGLTTPAPAAAQFRQKITNEPSRCSGEGPAVLVTVSGIRSSSGTIRVQSYRGTESDWLEKGRWLFRIEMPAQRGTMTFCMPLPAAGTYAIAVRHDANGNGETDLTGDGGGMSNNPSINIFNLGKPSYRRTSFPIGNEIKSMQINMRYM